MRPWFRTTYQASRLSLFRIWIWRHWPLTTKREMRRQLAEMYTYYERRVAILQEKVDKDCKIDPSDEGE